MTSTINLTPSGEALDPCSVEDPKQRKRALSHRDYLSTLQRPSAEEVARISSIQIQRESELQEKYQSVAEKNAATTIQKAYRGHRERRQLEGLTLDPSSRWVEMIKEWRYRMVTAPHQNPIAQDKRIRAASDVAKDNWMRVGLIAERASSAGENVGSPLRENDPQLACPAEQQSSDSKASANSMLMDLRYFLEMIDQKHRYGANLQIYHLEWQRSKTSESFFYWLDHGEGRDLSLPYCDREKLDREHIRYLSKEERKDYLVRVDEDGRLRWEKNGELITTSADHYKDSMHGIVPKDDNETPTFADEQVKNKLSEDRQFNQKIAAMMDPTRIDTSSSDEDNQSVYENHEQQPDQTSSLSDTPSASPREEVMAHQSITKDKTPRKRFHVSPATILNHLLRASVKPGTWIYVSDTLGRLYVGIKNSGSFQHASFLSGARISSAGSIGIEDGRLTFLSPLSGHYRPTTKSFRLFVDGLKQKNVDLSHLKVSQAYGILLGMEYYGKTKEGFRKVTRGKGNDRKENQATRKQEADDMAEELGISATDVVERHWREEHHRKGLAGLMDDLNIRRRSNERLRS